MDKSVSKRTTTSDETRVRLLRAAAELIAELGWGRVTTRSVAERAGLPHGAVSYHFRGKQELLTEAALHTFDQAFPTDDLNELQTLPDLAALLEVWMGEQGASDPVVARVGIEAMLEAERNPILQDRLAATLDEFRRVLATLTRAAIERGDVPANVSPEGLATLLAAVGDGLFLHARMDPQLDVGAALVALRALLRGRP
jgi:AcrR family transcriptional regulator